MHSRMMTISILLVFLGSGCRGAEKKEVVQVPHEEPAGALVADVLPVPEPEPVVEESVASSESTVEQILAEPEDPETVALRARIAELRKRYNGLVERYEALRRRVDQRLKPLERNLVEARQAIRDGSIVDKEDER